MMLLITYDVSTTTAAGRSRLRQVAHICLNYGQRVQSSVFECLVSPSQEVELKNLLSDTIDKGCDSLRIYHLGSNYKSKIWTIGVNKALDLEGTLIM